MDQALKTLAVVLVIAFAMSMPARAQTKGPGPSNGPVGPTVVQSLKDARDDDTLVTTLTGAALGAAGSVLAVNVITGGVALTPIVGLPASNLIGGNWLGMIGSLPLAGEMAIHTVTVAVVAFGGGLMGDYFAGD